MAKKKGKGRKKKGIDKKEFFSFIIILVFGSTIPTMFICGQLAVRLEGVYYVNLPFFGLQPVDVASGISAFFCGIVSFLFAALYMIYYHKGKGSKK